MSANIKTDHIFELVTPQLGLFAGAPELVPSQPVTKELSGQIAAELARSLEVPPLAHREQAARAAEAERQRTAAGMSAEEQEEFLTIAAQESASPDDVFLVVDGRTILDSAYHAAKARGDEKPNAGLKGFISALLRLIGTENPRHLAVVFDHPDGVQVRRKIDPAYKTGRPEKEPALIEQIARCQQFAAVLGCACFCSPEAEADDVIATLVRRSPPAWSVVISSTDKDLLALVARPKTAVTWWRDGGPQRATGERSCLERLGVLPRQVTDYLALVGDSADCIPGVPGIGPKTAAELLRQHGSLDAILANLGGLAGRGAERTRAILRTHRSAALRSGLLAQLRTDLSDPAIPSRISIVTALWWTWDKARRAELLDLVDRWGLRWLQGDLRDAWASHDEASA
jgi:5'-3' exonuclease